MDTPITHPLLARPITREQAMSLLGSIRSALRVTKTGGRNGGRPRCKCGKCAACKWRAKRSV